MRDQVDQTKRLGQCLIDAERMEDDEDRFFKGDWMFGHPRTSDHAEALRNASTEFVYPEI